MFKISGFLLVITTCGAIGFLKANELKKRYKKLLEFQKGVLEFKERIRLSYGELDRIKAESFKTPIDYSGLYKCDCEIMESLFREITLLDSESAYKRCELSIELLKQRHTEALERYLELGKLYKSIGTLFGIFICIFFL